MVDDHLSLKQNLEKVCKEREEGYGLAKSSSLVFETGFCISFLHHTRHEIAFHKWVILPENMASKLKRKPKDGKGLGRD